MSLETNTLNSFGAINYGGHDTWIITGDEVVRYSFDSGITWFESFIRFRANRDAVFDGNRWFVIDSTVTAGGQGRIIQNGTIANNFSMPDEDTDYPFFVTLRDPYIAAIDNIRIFIEYPSNDFIPFRQFELKKDVHWEEIGATGKFSTLIRILAPPHLVSPNQPILALNVLAKQIQIPTDWTDTFIQGFKFRIINSGVGNNDGVYTTVSSSYSVITNRTTITVVESFVSGTVSGQVGDDNQLLNKHATAGVLSFFTWEPSVLTDFEMFNIATNHQQIVFVTPEEITLLGVPITAISTAQDGPSYHAIAGGGCSFQGATAGTPIQVFAFVFCEVYPDYCNNTEAFPPSC